MDLGITRYMFDAEEIKKNLQKLQDLANKPEFVFLGSYWNRKRRIDDLFCCIIGLFPDGYRKALRNKALKIDKYQSIVAFNRLTDVLTQPVLFLGEFYQYRIGEVNDLFSILAKNIIIDLDILDNEVYQDDDENE